MTLQQQFERFMRESNWIEGERDTLLNRNTVEPSVIGTLHPNDMKAMEYMWVYANRGEDPSEEHLCKIHAMLSENRDDLRDKGCYRTMNVRIGNRLGTSPGDIRQEMNVLFAKWPKMGAWEIHAEYELIHCFEDLNGRTGRILWAWRMLQLEQDPFRMPFLQAYYYQTLSNYKTQL